MCGQLPFLIGHLYLIGVCLDDQRTKTIKTRVQIKLGHFFKSLLTTPHSIMNTIERTSYIQLRKQQTCHYDNRSSKQNKKRN